MLSKVDLYKVIRARHFNGCSVELLAKEFNLEEETITLLVDKQLLLDIDDPLEYEDTPIEGSVCVSCGSRVDGDGVPVNCTGACEHTDADYFSSDYPEDQGMPEELDFN